MHCGTPCCLQLQNTIADQEAQIEDLKQQLAAKDDQVST